MAAPKSGVPGKKNGVGDESTAQRELRESMSRLNVNVPPASKTLNEQAKTNIKRAGIRLDDDQTQVSSLSNRAPSLDGKSTTSGTTFALDEKESLRPDDSASSKAVEDEDSMSGPASGAPNSRVGSEAGGRAFRDQFYEVHENMGHVGQRPHPLSRKIIEGIVEEGPQVNQPPTVPAIPGQLNLSRPEVVVPPPPSMDLLYREPDEKLFEALDSPKDKYFLLRLEEDIINFIKGSSEPKIDLPPCNSFCRLLAHKLADYYALTHFVDNAVSSVTLYRTPYCRIPTPLTELAKTRFSSNNPTAPTAPPTMKIMRRPGTAKDSPNVDSGAGTTESSAIASKAASEVGEGSQHGTGVVSPTGSSAAKDKSSLTREEREARYKEKREELFGPQTDESDNVEPMNEISRTSSRNEKKRKKPKRDDDGFQARSLYNTFYHNVPYAINPYEQGSGQQIYFAQLAMQQGLFPGQNGMIGQAPSQQLYQTNFTPMPNANIYAGGVGQMPLMNSYSNQPQTFNASGLQQFNQQTPTQYFAQIHQPGGMSQPSSAMSSPVIGGNLSPNPLAQAADHQWTQNSYGTTYSHSQAPHSYLQTSTPVPYAYGQLPFQPSTPNGKPAHPVPGSFNRQNLNPQTRAFVPGGVPPPVPSNQFYGNNPNSSPMRATPMQFANGNGSMPYAPPPAFPPIHYSPSHQSQAVKHHQSAAGGNRKSSSQTQSSSPIADPPAPQSSLSKWATTANLPPKPPPPETPIVPEGQHHLPLNNQFAVNVQPINTGQPMPSYQNGVYTLPGVGGP